MTLPLRESRRRSLLALLWAAAVVLVGCERASQSTVMTSPPDEPSPSFRNVSTPTAYVGDAACASCHGREATAYRQHAMSQTFHGWTTAGRIETPFTKPLYYAPTGFTYSVVEQGGKLYQVESLIDAGGKTLHELRRPMDYVMGSGVVARTYFTADNGRLFQLPLTWYRAFGWDFSPGYQINNARFDRLMPDRCIACHSSYPQALPYIEGKYAEVRPGIGCERCHGPGALHAAERKARVPRDSGYDNTIVNPARLPLERRLDVCEQCHVHTPVTVLREGKDAFSYMPSLPLRDLAAFFKVSGSIDIVSHADRLRQSACFIATRPTSRPLECATCHNPHQPPADSLARSQTCRSCHVPAALQQRLARSSALASHTVTSDCVSCHMPRVEVRPVLHGTFTDHWIRVVSRTPARPNASVSDAGPIEPYYDRDKAGPEAKVYQGMGQIVYAARSSDGRVLATAATTLDRALGPDTTRGEAHFLLGVAYQQLGRTSDAIRALERSVRIDSNRPDRLRALAQSYERAGRGSGEVVPLYQHALAVQPALAWIRADYADYLNAQGMRADAEKAYRAAVAEQPNLVVAWFNLGTLLAGEDRLREASDAFQQAVRLDPLLAEALSPLLEVRTNGNAVTGVRSMGSPLATLPMRARSRAAVQLYVNTIPGAPQLLFRNVPSRASIVVLRPDGTLVRALRPDEAGAMSWDLMTDTGSPVAGGLYRARVQERDASGRPLAPRLLNIGIVRQRTE